jgi:hypothetical protein
MKLNKYYFIMLLLTGTFLALSSTASATEISKSTVLDFKNYEEINGMEARDNLSLKENNISGYADYKVNQEGVLTLKSRYIDNRLVQIDFLNVTTLEGNFTVEKVVHRARVENKTSEYVLNVLPPFDQVRFKLERGNLDQISPVIESATVEQKENLNGTQKTQNQGNILQKLFKALIELFPFI